MSRTRNIALTLLALLTAGCGQDGVKKAFKPDVTGRNSEVLVVINDNLKNDTVGRYLSNIFGDTYLGLPTDERIFDMHTVPHGVFDRNMHTFRNLVLVYVSDTISADTIAFYNDVWAQPQAVVDLHAKSKEALPGILQRNHIKIVSFFSKAERERLTNYYKKIRSAELASHFLSKWGVDITIPNQFAKCKPEHPEEISWVLCDTKEFQDGLMVYSYPYESSKSLEKETLLAMRDKFVHSNIGGPNGSFMQTETQFAEETMVYKYGTFKGQEVAELRGLWRMDTYPMGGPFLMRAHHDEKNNRILVTDGFVYYPSREQKRNHIKQLEAIMYSLTFDSKWSKDSIQ